MEETVANKAPELDMKLRAALYKALAAFQSELTVIEKTATVDAGKYQFKYAPLDEIMKTVYPLLSKNGLAIRHELNEKGVEAVLSHEEGGELRSGAIQVNRTGEMKSIGGSLTYARRYSVTMLLGIASEEDTDAGDLVVNEKKQTARDAAQNMDITEPLAQLEKCTDLNKLKQTWIGFTAAQRDNQELFNKKEEIKTILEQEMADTEPQPEPEPEPAIEPDEEVEPAPAPKKKK